MALAEAGGSEEERKTRAVCASGPVASLTRPPPPYNRPRSHRAADATAALPDAVNTPGMSPNPADPLGVKVLNEEACYRVRHNSGVAAEIRRGVPTLRIQASVWLSASGREAEGELVTAASGASSPVEQTSSC